jgi:vitamin B12 transporter
MKTKLHKVLILSCLAWNIVPAQEKVKEASTETILVTATKTLTEAREIGKSFTVITRKEIERSNHRDIVDVLRRVAGINIAKNGPHGSSAIIIRGNESYYTKVLLNGIALSDASGTQSSYTTLVNGLNLDNVERIEVIKGPQSTLYGSDAIGGVINIITKKGKGELFGGSLRQEFGKDKFRKSSLTLNGAEKGFSYSLSLSQEGQDAISATNEGANNSFVKDDDFYRSTNGTMNLSYQVNDYLKFGLAGHYSKADVEFDRGSPSSEIYLQNSTIRPSVSLMNLLDNRLDIEFSYSHADTRRTGDSGDFFSQTRSYEMFNTLELADWNLLNFGV